MLTYNCHCLETDRRGCFCFVCTAHAGEARRARGPEKYITRPRRLLLTGSFTWLVRSTLNVGTSRVWDAGTNFQFEEVDAGVRMMFRSLWSSGLPHLARYLLAD